MLEERLRSATYIVEDTVSLADIILICDLAPAFSKVQHPPHLSGSPMYVLVVSRNTVPPLTQDWERDSALCL